MTRWALIMMTTWLVALVALGAVYRILRLDEEQGYGSYLVALGLWVSLVAVWVIVVVAGVLIDGVRSRRGRD